MNLRFISITTSFISPWHHRPQRTSWTTVGIVSLTNWEILQYLIIDVTGHFLRMHRYRILFRGTHVFHLMTPELFADLFILLFYANSHYILVLLINMLLIFLDLLSLLFQLLFVNLIHLLPIHNEVLVVTHLEKAH